MKALFRGLFRCRYCGLVHGAYGVQETPPDGFDLAFAWPIEENHLRPLARPGKNPGKARLEPDRCPRCPSHPVCQFLGGTRIPSITEVEKPNRKRRGGWITIETPKKAG